MKKEILYRIILGLTLLVCALPCCNDDCKSLADDVEICGSTGITLQLDQHYPVVSATVNGDLMNILLDTGVGYYENSVSFGFISASLFGVEEGNVTLDSLCLSGMCIKNAPMYARDTPFSEPGDDAINGTIGMGLLRHFDIEFNRMENISLALSTGESGGDGPFEICEDQGYELIYDKWGRPLVEASADDMDLGEVLVDSGAFYTLMTKETAGAIGYLEDDAVEEGGCTIDGCVENGYFVSTLNEFCIYDECEENLEVKFPVWNAVGCSFLRFRRVVFQVDKSDFYLCID